ncbi:MAG TPA: hypothetical protein VHD69_01790 [Candidatus Paceibacterota bacterium]|nr:hypothetical protein [Candidatus Paceibacterota bacterium]
MNKKGIIAVIVIIILVVVGYMVWGGNGSTAVNNPVTTPVEVPTGVTKDTFAPVTAENTDTSLIGRLKSVSVSAAETGSRVALVNGKAQFSSDGVKGSIALGDTAVEATSGGAKYAFTTIGVTTGGKTYQYAVLFTDMNGTLADQSYDLIGSDITISGIRADEVSGGLVVTAAYKQGSTAKNKIMVVENGVFNPAKDINF